MTQGYKSWSYCMTNVSIPEVENVENSSTLAVSVPINLFNKLGFVSVNGPRETYFVHATRVYTMFIRYPVSDVNEVEIIIYKLLTVFIIRKIRMTCKERKFEFSNLEYF